MEKLADKLTLNGEGACPKCGGRTVWRQAHPYPVIVQSLFGLSFILFLVLFDKVREQRSLLAVWSGAQVALGVLLVRRRLRARKRVLHCIRCDSALDS